MSIRVVSSEVLRFLSLSLIIVCYNMQMGRSSGFNLRGIFTSHRPQQQQQRHPPSVSSSSISFSGVNQDHLHGSDMFQPAHSGHRPQVCPDDALIRLLEIKVVYRRSHIEIHLLLPSNLRTEGMPTLPGSK